MMAAFLLGYDVEHQDPAVTRHFLDAARRLHEDLALPCTLFIVGRTLRHSPDAFRALVGHPLFDLQQHTESHLLLKTVYQENDAGVRVFRGGSPDEVRADVAAAQATFEALLGVRPIGLTGPYGYYRGLCDRPDLVQIVREAGIRFLRTWGRNERDWQPVPYFAPFPLTALGFPDVWEYGIHGWQDVLRRQGLGWENLDAYVARMRDDIDRAAADDAVFSYCQHDWSSIRHDPTMTLTRRVVQYAQERGLRVTAYATHYAELSARVLAG
jgi:peptidoglycan/xylan/chitin deacetylase (PgdA/CDA1 family)